MHESFKPEYDEMKTTAQLNLNICKKNIISKGAKYYSIREI